MKHLSKKIATIACAIALVVVLGVALTACGSKSNATPSVMDVTKELTEKGYSAHVVRLSDTLLGTGEENAYLGWAIMGQKTVEAYDKDGNRDEANDKGYAVIAMDLNDAALADIFEANIYAYREMMIQGAEKYLPEAKKALEAAEKALKDTEADEEAGEEAIAAAKEAVENTKEMVKAIETGIAATKAIKTERNGSFSYIYGDDEIVMNLFENMMPSFGDNN